VRSLVRHESDIVGARARSQYDIRANRERFRAESIRFHGRLRVVVNPHPPKVCAEALLETTPQGSVQRLAATQTQCRRGGLRPARGLLRRRLKGRLSHRCGNTLEGSG
jgi:hypothetical protein